MKIDLELIEEVDYYFMDKDIHISIGDLVDALYGLKYDKMRLTVKNIVDRLE